MVFLCEGQSASGSITSCRECLRTATNNSAGFTLKRKPLNVWELKRDIVYKNDEMSASPSPPTDIPPSLYHPPGEGAWGRGT